MIGSPAWRGVEVGALGYTNASFYNGKPSVAVAVFSAPAPALRSPPPIRSGPRWKEALRASGRSHPQIGFNPTEYIRPRSTRDSTARRAVRAVGLVVIVIIVFLQS